MSLARREGSPLVRHAPNSCPNKRKVLECDGVHAISGHLELGGGTEGMGVPGEMGEEEGCEAGSRGCGMHLENAVRP